MNRQIYTLVVCLLLLVGIGYGQQPLPPNLYIATNVGDLTQISPAPTPGSFIYVRDGQPGTAPCTAGGSGAGAYWDGGSWNCFGAASTSGNLTSLNVQGNGVITGTLTLGVAGTNTAIDYTDSAGGDHTITGKSTGIEIPQMTQLLVNLATGSGTAGTVTFKANATQSVAPLALADSSNVTHFRVNADFNTVADVFAGGGTAPTVACGTGAGTGGTCTVTSGSTDMSGEITVAAGTTPTASATIFTVTFGNTHTVPPWCKIQLEGAPAALTSTAFILHNSQPKITANGTFLVTAGSGTVISGTNQWVYQCF